MRIAWGITGAAHLLVESFKIMERIAREHRVSAFLSEAGEEVVRMFGLERKLEEICPGGHFREIFRQSEQGASSPIVGRFAMGKYDLLIVTPATANTVAKVVHGIADTLVTNAVAQAGKGETPTWIVPCDPREGYLETVTPYIVRRSECEGCGRCVEACPQTAVKLVDGKAWIDLTRCVGCGACAGACPVGAISGGETYRMRVRKVDAKNVEKLRDMEDIEVFEHPKEILRALEDLEPG